MIILAKMSTNIMMAVLLLLWASQYGQGCPDTSTGGSNPAACL